MRTAAIGLTTVLVFASGSFGPANADSNTALLVPGYEATKDLPGARELPDPKTDYKVVFADGQDAKNQQQQDGRGHQKNEQGEEQLPQPSSQTPDSLRHAPT